MTIGELSRQAGVPASAIRYYERIGVLPAPTRRSGRRAYSPEALYRLAVLKLAQSCGFTLDESRRLLRGGPGPPSSRWQRLAREKLAELDAQAARIVEMKRLLDQVAACRCPDLLECGRRAAPLLLPSHQESR
jgi:MerR family transcriptional regulator, redox-sensitive transcriptional activator SoxR